MYFLIVYTIIENEKKIYYIIIIKEFNIPKIIEINRPHVSYTNIFVKFTLIYLLFYFYLTSKHIQSILNVVVI